MDEARLRAAHLSKNVGSEVLELRVAETAELAERLGALNEVLGLHRNVFPVVSPAGCARYEAHMISADEVLVLFHMTGQLSRTASLTVNLGRPVSDVTWVAGTINGMFPEARSLLAAGVDDAALSAFRRMLRFKLDPLPAMKGSRKLGDDHREVFLAFGMSYFGHVIDLRPSVTAKGGGLKAKCHRFGDRAALEGLAEEVLS